MSNLQSGLFLAGLGVAVLFAWWSGAFALIGDELAGKVRGQPGQATTTTSAPAPSASGAAPQAI